MSGQPGPMGPRQPGRGTPPPPRKKRGPVLGLALGGVALVVAVLLVAGFLVFRSDGKAAAVETFFQALRDADSAVALGQLASPPPDTSLITDAVLQQSVELGGVSMIDVVRSTDDSNVDNAGWVTVHLRAGDDESEVQYRVVKQNGEWKLADAVAEVTVAKAVSQGLKPIFNGATPKDDTTFHLLPGVYQVSTGSTMVTWDQDRAVFLGGVGKADTLSMKPELTEEGGEAVDAALAKMYQRCLASTELQPKDCPFHVIDPRFKEGSATWQEVEAPTWGASLMGLYVSGQYEGVVKADYTYVDSEGRSHQKSQTIPYKPLINVDLSQDPPEVIFPG